MNDDFGTIAIRFLREDISRLRNRQSRCFEWLLKRVEPSELIHFARTVLNSRWPELEVLLLKSQDKEQLVCYARVVIKGRWADIEQVLLDDDEWSNWLFGVAYARDVLRTRWTELEKAILKSQSWFGAVHYAETIIRGRWPELERRFERGYVGVGPEALYMYASQVVKGRLPDTLHNRMLAEAVKCQANRAVQMYFSAKKYKL